MKLTIYCKGYKFETKSCTYLSGSTQECDIVEVLEERPAYVRYWEMQYELISAEHKSIIEAVLGDVKVRILTEDIRMPDKLLNIAINKLAKHEDKHMKTCSRCGGSGHHSFNQRDGTVCFKCRGLKYTLPKITPKWIAQVKETYST